MSGRRQHGEGTIRSYATRGGDRYRIEWYQPADPSNPDSVAVRRSKQGFATKKEAATALRKALIDVEAGRITAAHTEGVTVGQYAREWLQSRRLAPTTKAAYDKILRLHITPHIGDRRVRDLRPTTLAGLYRVLEENGRADGGGLGASSVRKVHSLLSTVLQAAVEDGVIATNPARHKRAEPPTAREIKAQRPDLQIWTEEQVRRFLHWARDHSGSYAAWVTLLGTGLRRGELLGLRWGDINLAAGTLAVRRAVIIVPAGPGRPGRVTVAPTKSAHDRVLSIDNDVVEVLRQRRATMGSLGFKYIHNDAPVFTDNGEVMYPETLSKRWRADVASARKRFLQALDDPAELDNVLPTLHLHGCRHTHLTHLLLNGVPPKVVQARAGHETLSITTETYGSHISQGDEADAMRAYYARRPRTGAPTVHASASAP